MIGKSGVCQHHRSFAGARHARFVHIMAAFGQHEPYENQQRY
jgi:hypothetical protein